MSLIQKLTPDFSFTDARGTITQLVSDGYRQVNAVFTAKGAVRGNFHYHKFTDEAFFILKGKVSVTAKRGNETQVCVFADGDMFLIEKNVRHDFAYEEDTYLVGLYTSPVILPDGTKDIFTDE